MVFAIILPVIFLADGAVWALKKYPAVDARHSVCYESTHNESQP